MNETPGRVGRTAQDVREYVSLYMDQLRLSLIDNLSTLCNTLFGVFIVVLLLGIAALFFSLALTWMLGMVLGSMLLAVFLMGCLFVVLALVVYAMRHRLILNPAIRMFSRMMYDISKKQVDDEK